MTLRYYEYDPEAEPWAFGVDAPFHYYCDTPGCEPYTCTPKGCGTDRSPLRPWRLITDEPPRDNVLLCDGCSAPLGSPLTPRAIANLAGDLLDHATRPDSRSFAHFPLDLPLKIAFHYFEQLSPVLGPEVLDDLMTELIAGYPMDDLFSDSSSPSHRTPSSSFPF